LTDLSMVRDGNRAPQLVRTLDRSRCRTAQYRFVCGRTEPWRVAKNLGFERASLSQLPPNARGLRPRACPGAPDSDPASLTSGDPDAVGQLQLTLEMSAAAPVGNPR
jgi:hypothetical protein